MCPKCRNITKPQQNKLMEDMNPPSDATRAEGTTIPETPIRETPIPETTIRETPAQNNCVPAVGLEYVSLFPSR